MKNSLRVWATLCVLISFALTLGSALSSPTPTAVRAAATASTQNTNTVTSGFEKFAETVSLYAGYMPALLKGAAVTLQITALGMVLAVLFGLCLALTRIYAPKGFSWMATVYIEAVRGTPLLIQICLLFYGLPNIGIDLSPMVAAVLGLGLNYAAYEAENYRAGILSVPKSQIEAALALGMTRGQALRHVVVPQAMRLVLPPITNDFISLLKDSSLVSIITVVELTKAYTLIAASTFNYLGMGILAAAIYFILGIPFVQLARHAEAHFSFEGRAPEKKRKQKPESIPQMDDYQVGVPDH